MGKKYLGIDIEDRFLKLVVMKDGKVQDKIVGAASKSKIDEKIKALL